MLIEEYEIDDVSGGWLVIKEDCPDVEDFIRTVKEYYGETIDKKDIGTGYMVRFGKDSWRLVDHKTPKSVEIWRTI